MMCVICRMSETEAGLATVTLHRGECSVIIKGVPAQVCKNCGEYYLSEEVASRVFQLAETAVREGAELEVRRYAA